MFDQDLVSVRGPSSSAAGSKLSPSLSEEFFGISWDDYYPLRLNDRDEIRRIQYPEMTQFIRNHYVEIFKDLLGESSSPNPLSQDAKRRYYERAGDLFGFFHENQMVGYFVGTPVDWSSYFLRNSGILPEFRGLGFYRAQMLHILMVLEKHGVERAQGEVSPANLRHIKFLTLLDFSIVGNVCSDRWGLMLQVVRYLRNEPKDRFLRQFCKPIT